MILSDRGIHKALLNNRIKVVPLAESDIQPCSIDLHLGDTFISKDLSFTSDEVTLAPGSFVLATTREWVEIGDDILGRLEGKSSIARLGLIIHTTAGFIDPGFRGEITLEIANLSSKPVVLSTGQPIAQICFEELSSPCNRPYGSFGLGSHYQGQQGATASYMS